jgi:hypothetical protein
VTLSRRGTRGGDEGITILNADKERHDRNSGSRFRRDSFSNLTTLTSVSHRVRAARGHRGGGKIVGKEHLH